MVAIRLARMGKKNHAHYRIIVSDKRKDTIGPYLELVGTFNPHQNPSQITLKEDRVKYWLSVGAQPSASVHNLLVEKKLIDAPKLVIAKAKKADEPVAEATPAAPAAVQATPKAETETEPAAVAEAKAAPAEVPPAA